MAVYSITKNCMFLFFISESLPLLLYMLTFVVNFLNVYY